jgi:ATP-binding cassette, subfamily B, bacterial
VARQRDRQGDEASNEPVGEARGWGLLREVIRPYWRLTAAGVTAGMIWTAAKVSVPALTATAIDKGILSHRHGALLRFALIILAVGVVSAVCTGTRRYLAFRVGWRVEADLRERLYAHLQRLHFAFHDEAQTGQLMARAATDLQQIQGLIVFVPITIANALTVAGVAAVMVVVNWKLALVALATLPLLNVAAKAFSSRIHPTLMSLQEELAGLSTVVEETVTGMRAVKGFGAEAIQAERMDGQAGRVFGAAMSAARVRARYNPVLDLLPTLSLVIVLWFGGHQVISGRLTIGQLVEFNAYVLLLIWPLRMMGMLIAQAQRALAGARRIDEILSTAPAIVSSPRPRKLPRDTEQGLGEVVFQAVRFGYQPDHPVLDGFDLTIQPGESVALVGPTASGKTTVARLVPRFYDVDAGAILLDNVDIRDLRLRDLRQAVGIVFEDTFLFSETIRANIAFADPSAGREQVERAARLAGAHEFIVELPEGYDTEIGERGFSLSGGQRQRLALARAIVADPRVLILDDATSAVDPTKEHEIREALLEVMRGRTTIVIAHRPATIALADRVVLLDRGRAVAEGTHDQLLASSARYRAVLARAEAGIQLEIA